jgi:hypothetical protein
MPENDDHKLPNMTLDELRQAANRSKAETSAAKAALERQQAEAREALKRADKSLGKRSPP